RRPGQNLADAYTRRDRGNDRQQPRDRDTPFESLSRSPANNIFEDGTLHSRSSTAKGGDRRKAWKWKWKRKRKRKWTRLMLPSPQHALQVMRANILYVMFITDGRS